MMSEPVILLPGLMADARVFFHQIVSLSLSRPVIILPLLWLRTGQRPSGKSWAGAALAVAGMALIFTR